MSPADARRQAEGRGIGRGADYRPWLTVQEVPSHGLSSREYGYMTGREHHCLSSGEADCFVLLEHLPFVTDIREQFPLLPLDTTRRIAAELGVAHPRAPGTGCLNVCTTDFVVTVAANGQTWDEAIAYKQAVALDDGDVLDKLEIERRFWAERGVPWRIVTDQDLPTTRLKNVRWARGRADPRGFDLPAGYTTDRLIPLLLDDLMGRPDAALASACRAFDDRVGLPLSTALSLVRHALATGRWEANLDAEFDPARLPLPGLRAAARTAMPEDAA